MTLCERMRQGRLYLDGAMGTELVARGLSLGELPERWCLSHADEVVAVHRAYARAGADILSTNTFGANRLKYAEDELSEIVPAAVELARRAAAEEGRSCLVALDIGPSGRMLRPYGDLDFEEAVGIFADTVRLGAAAGADLVLIETMGDLYEAKAALLAAREASSLPVLVSCAFGADGKLLTGADAAAVVTTLEALGACAIGANCSLGPSHLRPVIEAMLAESSVPVLLKPNAGLPRMTAAGDVYELTPERFAAEMAEAARAGVTLLGGCCGTTPAHIAATVAATHQLPVIPVEEKQHTAVSSYTHAVRFEDGPVLIGERINPTGKPRFRAALREGDRAFILREALSQAEAGAHLLDVNVGLPELDEGRVLTETVEAVQAVCDLPLALDTSDPAAMERAMRRYNGKPLVNSVSAKAESLAAVLPLVKRYGGTLIALTLDEEGIPPTAEGRLRLAERIVAAAEEHGICRRDLVFDPLTMAVSADPTAAYETLRAVRLIRERLGCHTSLGVSNVSFGLPARAALNAAFLTLALGEGLSAAILNPHAPDMRRAVLTYRALMGRDAGFRTLISAAEAGELATSAEASVGRSTTQSDEKTTDLQTMIVKGLRLEAAQATEELLSTLDPMTIVEQHVVPALDRMGGMYERGEAYLPSLLMSAEAAAACAEVLRSRLPVGASRRFTVILATVKGDIHDIGKNIVKLLFENYGYRVVDLGRDVPPERVARAAVEERAALVGLSALMTTTVPSMREAVRLVKACAPTARVIVGGAVLTAEVAADMGADAYAPDAMAAVRYAEGLMEESV